MIPRPKWLTDCPLKVFFKFYYFEVPKQKRLLLSNSKVKKEKWHYSNKLKSLLFQSQKRKVLNLLFFIFFICMPTQRGYKKACWHIIREDCEGTRTLKNGHNRNLWPLCHSQIKWGWAPSKEDLYKDEEPEPRVEWGVQAYGQGSSISTSPASCIWLGKGSLLAFPHSPMIYKWLNCTFSPRLLRLMYNFGLHLWLSQLSFQFFNCCNQVPLLLVQFLTPEPMWHTWDWFDIEWGHFGQNSPHVRNFKQ